MKIILIKLKEEICIIFAKNGNIFMHNSTELIRPHFTGQNDGKIIIVNDVDDKIKSAQK